MWQSRRICERFHRGGTDATLSGAAVWNVSSEIKEGDSDGNLAAAMAFVRIPLGRQIGGNSTAGKQKDQGEGPASPIWITLELNHRSSGSGHHSSPKSSGSRMWHLRVKVLPNAKIYASRGNRTPPSTLEGLNPNH